MKLLFDQNLSFKLVSAVTIGVAGSSSRPPAEIEGCLIRLMEQDIRVLSASNLLFIGIAVVLPA